MEFAKSAGATTVKLSADSKALSLKAGNTTSAITMLFAILQAGPKLA